MKRLYLQVGEEQVELNGARTAAPVRGAWRALPQVTATGVCEEQIDLVLGGTGDRVAALAQIDRLLIRTAEQFEAAWLVLQPDDRSHLWRSRVLEGRVEPLGGGQTGQGVRLRLLRMDCWEGDLHWLLLQNDSGSAGSAGLPVWNHSDKDPAHGNWVEIPAAEVEGSLPAALTLEIFNDIDPDQTIPCLWSALRVQGQLPPPPASLEGESAFPAAGVTAVVEADSTASNGQALRLAWSAPQPVELLGWNLPQTLLDACGGRVIHPVLRWIEPPAPGMWLGWALCAGSEQIEAAVPAPVESLARLHWLSPLALPTGWSEPSGPSALTLKLIVCGGGTAVLDDLILLPAEGLRQMEPFGGLPPGWSLVDDGLEGWAGAQRIADGASRGLRVCTGDPLFLLPGQTHRLAFLWEGDPAARLRVRAACRPRVREP